MDCICSLQDVGAGVKESSCKIRSIPLKRVLINTLSTQYLQTHRLKYLPRFFRVSFRANRLKDSLENVKSKKKEACK